MQTWLFVVRVEPLEKIPLFQFDENHHFHDPLFSLES